MKKKLFKELKKSLEQARDGEISKKTLVQVDKSAENFKNGIVSKPIDLDKYKEESKDGKEIDYSLADSFMAIFGFKRAKNKRNQSREK